MEKGMEMIADIFHAFSFMRAVFSGSPRRIREIARFCPAGLD